MLPNGVYASVLPQCTFSTEADIVKSHEELARKKQHESGMKIGILVSSNCIKVRQTHLKREALLKVFQRQ